MECFERRHAPHRILWHTTHHGLHAPLIAARIPVTESGGQKMHNRRFEIRIQRDDPVEIDWTDPTGKTHHDAARLEDISPSGAAVRAPSPVHFGTTVSFAYQDQTLIGKVRHCVRREAYYLLGLEFELDHGWSRRPS